MSIIKAIIFFVIWLVGVGLCILAVLKVCQWIGDNHLTAVAVLLVGFCIVAGAYALGRAEAR